MAVSTSASADVPHCTSARKTDEMNRKQKVERYVAGIQCKFEKLKVINIFIIKVVIVVFMDAQLPPHNINCQC